VKIGSEYVGYKNISG